MQDPESVPIHLKLTLSIKEASEYSNIGINKIDAIPQTPKGSDTPSISRLIPRSHRSFLCHNLW